MLTLDVARRIKAPADEVWAFISGDGLRNSSLGEYVESIVPDGPEGEGVTFTTTLKNGIRVKEYIEKIDNKAREFTYRIVDAGPMPYARHRAVMRIQPAGDNECLYSSWVEMIVEGDEDKVRESWYATNRKKADMIASFFE